jgi:hypothetical protein
VCRQGRADGSAGDTYYVKFTNSSTDTYRVYYMVIDGSKVIQDTTSIVVPGKSSNAKGPYHCSPNAVLRTIRMEKVK